MVISVIIPTYNRAYLISAAIDSVLKQTYTNFELLVVDDHSTDNTKDIVENYQDKRVRYLLNTRSKGAQGARNTGLNVASGDWVAMLDSDDIWLPHKLAKQINYLKKAKENIVGLATGSNIYDFESNTLISEHLPNKHFYTTEDLLYKNYLRGFSSFLFKKEEALKNGGFDESFPAMQDMDFYISLSMNGEIHVIQEPLVNVRTHNNDRISKNFCNKFNGALELHRKHYGIISSSIRLLNRSKSRMIVYSIKRGDNRWLIDLHWIFIGLFIDIKNFIWTIRSMKNK